MKKFILTLLLFPALSWGCVTVDECRPLAEAGEGYAQQNLGFMYKTGYGGAPQDSVEAAVWFHEAAEQGFIVAQDMLAGMYARGEGVPQDYSEAYVWLSLRAASGRESDIKRRNFAADLLSPADLAAAQSRASQLYEQINQ